jgi:hypothetical protein
MPVFEGQGVFRYNAGMCTMTWFHELDGYQVFFNRDERRTRKPALAPAIHARSGRRYIAPLDGDFGGSWLAVNECGLTLALHNGYVDADEEAARSLSGHTSRGMLVTSLIGLSSAEEAIERLKRDDLQRYRSFLLTLFQARRRPVVASWAGQTLHVEACGEDVLPFVSSSFDTEKVRASRIELFRRMEQETGLAPAELHLAFLESHSPRRGAYSPCMHRPDACTVSFSHVCVEREQIRFHYSPRSPCRGRPRGEPVSLPRTFC